MHTHGRHIKIMAKGDPESLGSLSNVHEVLCELVRTLGMRLMGAPHMYEVETEVKKLGVEPFEDEGGVTGVCVLSTSHCAIHTWPLRSFFILDIFSCRHFETIPVSTILIKSLGAREIRLEEVDCKY